ncbi:autotransporter-associated beta strand repeat-containing protein [Erwinia sp.]|uniref:autotransporter-associated beta strand repeat-containing protein n=1 Tax=Erwinia citreus TaxID=558 RepID=UPI003C76F95E
MNKVYRLVWSCAASCYIPVSENSSAKGKKSSSATSLLLTALIVGGAGFSDQAFAVDVDWSSSAHPSYLFPEDQGIDYDTVINTGFAFTLDNQSATNHYPAGTVLNILGAIPTIGVGSTGSSTSVAVLQALPGTTGSDPNRITVITATDSSGTQIPITAANIDQFTYSPNPANPQQNQELNVEIPGLEGSKQVISIYDSGTFASADDTAVSALLLPVYDPDSMRIFNGFGIASVSEVGGTANINIGADTAGSTPIAAPTNRLDLLAKNSVLAKADGSSTAPSAVNWQSDNYIHFLPAPVLSNDTQNVTAQSAQYNYTLTLPNYVQVGERVTQFGSKTFTITSSEDIADVNDYLTGQGQYAGDSQIQYWLTAGATVNGETIDSAVEAQNTYNAIITGLLAKEDQTTINLTYHVWDDKGSHTNNATLPVGDLNVIYATGANATGTVTSTGSLAVDGASAVMRADQGAIITNNGAINAWRSSKSSPATVGMLATNATAINNGTLNAGLFIEKDGTNQDVNNAGSVAMSGLGASTLTNNGQINAALTDTTTANAVGIRASGTTVATNTAGGTIALTGNANNIGGRATGYGVYADQAATFTNNGTIYLGVEPILTNGAAPVDVDMTGGGSLAAGIYSQSSGNIVNNGLIRLGENTRNSAGIFSDGGTGDVTNTGNIQVLGQLTNDAAATNYGLYITDNTGTVVNSGDILVDGDNNMAIYVQARAANATVSSTQSSEITVGSAGDTGGTDNDPFTYRNYAVYAEGLNTHQAVVNLSSTIRLLSAGAIGVHARGNAIINVDNQSSLSLENSQQIGYYAYGSAAKINVANASVNDNGQTSSVLFAVDDGATFNGDNGSGTPYQLTLTGTDSTGVFANGFDDKNNSDASDDVLTTLNTGPAIINVNAEGAVGVKVTGGAKGTINDGGIILNHDDTTAVLIDGRNYNIDGKKGTDEFATNVTSNAATTSGVGQSGIVGYDVSHLGNLLLQGTSGIQLNGSNSKGIWLHDNGSATVNAPVQVLGTGGNNIGVDIQNAGVLTNNSTITVGGGAGNVGIRVQGAGAVVQKLGSVTANGGLAAVQLLGSGASLTINGTGNTINASGGADGVLMDTGSSSFTANNSIIGISGTGAGINNKSNTGNINLNNVTINAADGPAIRTAVTFNAEGTNNILNVSGSGQGFAFEEAGGAATTGDLSIGTGYTINGSGADSTGILANTDGNVISGANITMGGSAGAAIDATNANSLTNNGTIVTSSNTGSTILAANTTQFVNNGSITASGTSNSNSMIVLNGTATNRTITNSGSLTNASTDLNAKVIDASGSANTTVTNSGTLLAATNTLLAVLTGSGNDSVSLTGGNTRGEINLGSGNDQFSWTSGLLAGGVTFSGTDGNDSATIGDVSLTNTAHILSEGGTGSTLTFSGTHQGSNPALVGSFAADDQAKGTNIGSGWSTLTLNGAATDVRLVDDLTLSGTPQINVEGGATLRSGDSVTDNTEATLHNYAIFTDGADSLVSFDGGNEQNYSGVISGTGGMERIGAGKTNLLADNTYTGNTLIGSGSELSLGNGGTTGTLSEATNITDNGILTVNRSDDVTLNGIISGSGAFHQIGAGITRLGGNNSYAAETLISNGTLLVNGDQSAATGLTTVGDNTTLGGNGTLGGSVVFGNDTILRPGDNGRGTLTINGDLTLNDTTDNQFELGQSYTAGGALNDFVNVKGTMILDGVLNVTLSPGGSFLPGVYRLFSYAGATINNTAANRGLEIGTLPANDGGTSSIQTNIANQVNLILNYLNPASALQFWDGGNTANHGDGTNGNSSVDGGAGIWRANVAGVTNDWTTADGVGNAPWSQTAFAIFQGTAAPVIVSDVNGRVINSGMQFTSDGYVVSQLNTDSQLHYISTVTDSFPQAVPAPTNTYTAQGESVADTYYIIRVGDGATGSDITTTMNADLVQDELDDNRIRLLKTDPGRLILNGDNDFSAGIEVWQGTLQASRDASLGASGTSLTLKNGAALQAGADFTTNRLIFLDATGGGTLDVYGHTLTPAGVIAGGGALNIEDTSAGTDEGVLELNQQNSYSGDTTIAGKNGTGQLTVNANTTGVFGTASSDIGLTDLAQLNFTGAAQAESHAFSVDNSTLQFNDTSSAAQSSVAVTEGGQLNFTDQSSGGTSTITVDATSGLAFADTANAGSAVVTNLGDVTFAGNAQAQNARVDNQSNGQVDISAATQPTSIGSLSGAGNVVLGAGTLVEGNLGRNDLISGVIGGSGGNLVKTGNGTLTLSGDNSWTGTTRVQQGTLLINGDQSAATGAVTVNNLATLGGEGTSGGNVTVADGGHLAAGRDLSSVGVLTVGGLTLNQNAQVDFQFGEAYSPGGTLNDLINVNGDLNLNGKLNITQTAGGQFDVGLYRVFNYSGTLTDNQLDIGTAPEAAADLYVQTSIAGQVNLINHAGTVMRFWDGFGGANNTDKNNGEIDGGSGVWQNSIGNDNWTTDQTTPDGRFNTPFSDTSFAIFGGQAGTVSVNNSLGVVAISGAQFATDGYVFNNGVITTNTADTVLRVGDGTTQGADYTATINSVLAGSGGIRKTDLGTLVLNGNNTYSGGTTVSAGALQVAKDASMGAANTALTLAGGILRYGAAFNSTREVKLANGGGTVDTNGFDVSLLNSVTGAGDLTKAGSGVLTLTKDSAFQGITAINAGTLQLGDGGTGGNVSGDIENRAILAFNRSDEMAVNGDISGSGQVWQRGSGVTTLNGNNSWSGITLVQNGTLRAGSANRFSSASDYVVSQNGTLDSGGFNQTVGNLVNQGTVNLQGGDVGSTLTVNGDYVGMNGTLKIAAQQHSPGVADRLVISGGTASGLTLLNIDVSQLGEPTEGDGIKVVEAQNGATTTAQTTRDAFTIGADKLLAGAYQYQLFAGNAAGAGEDWFLRAGYRPDVPGFNSLGSIIRQADLTVLGTLHQRVGDEQPWQAAVPEDQEGRFWARYIYKTVNQKMNDATGTTSDSNYNGMQMGRDFWQNDQWRAGMYATFLDTDSSVSGNTGLGGGSAYNSTFSSYLGGYATWTDDTGFYVDNVLQYGHHEVDLKNNVDRISYHPDGNSFVASVEVGKPWKLGDSRWALEPQGQLIYQYSDFQNVTLDGAAKTNVNVEADAAVIGRLGARLTADYDTDYGKVKPYVRVNLWQELSDGQDTVTYRNTSNNAGKTSLSADQRYSATEAAVGTTWAVSNEVQAYTEVGKVWDNGGDSKMAANISASVGLKMRF